MSGSGAPFVYFDMAPLFGTMNGAIQVELVSRIIHRADGTDTRIEFATTGHLRCSPAAAADLIDALTKALKMLETASAPMAQADKLN